MSLLSVGKSYVYAPILEVRRLSGDQIEWTDGMIYPVLHRMEDCGDCVVYLGVDWHGILGGFGYGLAEAARGQTEAVNS